MANFSSPMPPRTNRAHYTPSWRGDRPAALQQVGRKRLGPGRVRAIDVNLQVSKDGTAWAMHWGIPKKDNFKYILATNGRVRKMTAAELRRNVSAWTDAQIFRWRRGRVKPSARPHTYREMARIAVLHHVVICGELKSRRFAEKAVAERLVHDAKLANHPAWFMALINMKNCRGKCEAIRDAGGHFALIFGRFRGLARRAPADWDRWRHKPTRIWGPAKWPL